MSKANSKEALKRWEAIPADKRQLLLGNVFCSDCPGCVTICDFSMKVLGKQGLLLEGFCGTCGRKVVRVLEGEGS